jgi:uncharacterized membrane protein (UPF0127 family)
MKLDRFRSSSGMDKLCIRRACGFWQRFRGLMLTRPLTANQALLIERCTGVHTCFMRYAIDVAYIDGAGKVVKLVTALRPWRFSFGGKDAVQALELAAGCAARRGIGVGSMLSDIGAGSRSSEC